MRDELFGFRSKHSEALQLASLFERVTRNFGEKRLTDAAFLEVSKDFNAVVIDGLLYKLTVLSFPSYPVKTISFYFPGRTFETSFQTATSYRRCVWVGMT